MLKIMRTPPKYVQGRDALLHIKDQIEMLGDKFFIVASKTAMKVTKCKIETSFSGEEEKLVFELFNGISSKGEIERIRGLVRENNCNVIIGIGGGSTLDTAKAAAYFEKLPVVIIPTVPATDAPCTALSVIYNDDGEFSNYIFYPKNPDVVIADTSVLCSSPVKFLVAGMGDALGTYFEARACYNANSKNLVDGHITKAGLQMAKLCYETLLEDGYKAKLSVESKSLTPAVENVLEANIYLSGVGAENGGLAVAHSVYNGFTILEECEKIMHGEMVAFGTIVQLVLENSPKKELYEVIEFCNKVGLPINFKQIGLENPTKEMLMKVAKLACAEGETIHNMLKPITEEELVDAFYLADAIGTEFLA